jgi:hypothetical protein
VLVTDNNVRPEKLAQKFIFKLNLKEAVTLKLQFDSIQNLKAVAKESRLWLGVLPRPSFGHTNISVLREIKSLCTKQIRGINTLLHTDFVLQTLACFI